MDSEERRRIAADAAFALDRLGPVLDAMDRVAVAAWRAAATAEAREAAWRRQDAVAWLRAELGARIAAPEVHRAQRARRAEA